MIPYIERVKALVTSKGQVTIPKSVRDQFGINAGTEIDFTITTDGIRVRKVADPRKRLAVFGCLKQELAGRSTKGWLDELRGPLDLPNSPKGKRKTKRA